MGIGINTGVFLAGNVGSEKRLEYTAMGDTINSASRLEGLTKGSGHSVFIADSTREALTRPTHDLVYLGEHEVRGRAETIRVWSLPPQPACQTAPAGAPSEPAPQVPTFGVPATAV
jgi:adenylate cyclase